MTPTRRPTRLRILAVLPPAILGVLFLASTGRSQKPPRFVRGEERFEVRTDDARHSDRRISYEIRLIETDAGAWRERIKDGLQTVAIKDETGEEIDDSAWLLDDAKMRAFMMLVQEDWPKLRLRGPKTTAFEGACVTVVDTRDQRYIGHLEVVQEPGSLALKPIAKTLALGSVLAFSGVVQPDGTNLTVDLRDEELVAFHDLSRTVESADGRITGQYQVPTTIKQRRRFSRSIPKDTTLMISLGFQERSVSVRPSGAAGTASALLEAVGAPTLPPARRELTTERLILISPRPIVSKDD